MSLPYCMVCLTHHGFLDQLCPALNPRAKTMRSEHAVTIERSDTSKRTLSIEDDRQRESPYVKIVRNDGEVECIYVKDISFSESARRDGNGADVERDAERLRDRAHLLMRAADELESAHGGA